MNSYLEGDEEQDVIRRELSRTDTGSSRDHASPFDLLRAASSNSGMSSTSVGSLELTPLSTPQLTPVSTGLSDTGEITRGASRALASRKLKQVYWKWSTYRLPIGMLCITEVEEETADSTDQSGKKRYGITFTLSLPSFVQHGLIQVAYNVSTQANSMPFWQCTQMGAITILPPDIMQAGRDMNLMEIGRLLSTLSPQGVYQILEALSKRNKHSYPFIRRGYTAHTWEDVPYEWDNILAVHDRSKGYEQQ